jgi:hypothetical protein
VLGAPPPPTPESNILCAVHHRPAPCIIKVRLAKNRPRELCSIVGGDTARDKKRRLDSARRTNVTVARSIGCNVRALARAGVLAGVASMKRTSLFALMAAALLAFATIAPSTVAARPGFRGGGWHGGGVRVGGWRGAGWRGGWRGGGWRGAAWRGGWRGGGWRGGWGGGWAPGVALGAAVLGIAAATTWGYPGYYAYPGYGYGYYSDPCLRQVWWRGAWRWTNVCR